MAIDVDFDGLFKQLGGGIIALAKSTVTSFKDDAINDGLELLDGMKDKLARWTILLANGELTQDDFEWLVKSQKSLAKMSALKHAGLAAIGIDQFKSSILSLITDTVFGAIKL